MKYFTWILGLLATIPFTARAHVSYVITKEEMVTHAGPDTHYLWTAIANKTDILLMVGTIIGIVLLGFIFYKVSAINSFFKKVVTKLQSYHEFIPWITRLALGIALIGAGTAKVLISPTFADGGSFALLQILLGFFFLAGFLLIPTAIATIVLFMHGIIQEPYLVGNLDFFVLAISVLVFHSARPGVDDMFGISLFQFIKIKRTYLAPIIRLGLGGAFIYLALYEKLLNPGFTDLVVHQYNLINIISVSPQMWVFSIGVTELLLGILIVLGWYTRLVAFVSILVVSLTFFYFQESVYSHVTLFSALAILAIEGGGLWSIDARRKD